MSDMTIDNATRDTSVGGGELVPVSDAGTPKSMSVSQIKDYVLAQIAALTAASGVSVSDDSVYILKGGALTRVTAATFAAAMFNEAFGRASVVQPNGNEVLAIKDSDTRKTITFTALKTWLEGNLSVTPDLTLSGAAVAGTLGDSDLALVVQAGGGKKVTLGTLKDYVLGKLAAFIAAQTAAQSVTSSDVVLLIQGGNVRKATVAQLTGGGGDVKGPSSTTEDKIPQWDSTNKTLKDGLAVTQTVDGSSTGSQVPTAAAVQSAINSAISGKGDVRGPSSTTEDKIPQWDSTAKTLKDGLSVVDSIDATGSNGNVPTEKAVRDAINDAAGVGAPEETPANGNIPQWGSGKVLTDGKSVQTSIRNAANASNDAIPTEKAVRDALEGKVGMPATHNEDCLPTWGSGAELKAGKSVTTSIASSQNASHDNIPTEKAVRDALPVEATTSSAGLLSAADKAKLDGIVDNSNLAEIGGALSDNDTIQVKQSDTTYKKSLISRFWTYISSKLSAFKIDDLAQGDDNTDLDANTARHGLCPKLSGSTAQFLRGDGSFATPTGMTPFVGTSGLTDGAQGLVPAPTTEDGNKFLASDGSWKSVAAAAAEDVAEEVMALTRYDTVFIPAAAMCPSASNGATASAVAFTNTKHDCMAFDALYDKACEFDFVFPDDWDKGAIKAKFLWTVNNASASANQNVKWEIGCVSRPDGSAVSIAPSSYTSVMDALSQVNNLQRTGATAALTPDGTSGDGNLVHFIVRRQNTSAPSSPLTVEALLLGVVVQFARTNSMEAWS